MSLSLDSNGNVMPLMVPRGSETLTTSGDSQQSSTLSTEAIRVVCLQDCWYKLGKNPTADNTGTSTFLPANVVETLPVEVKGDTKIAVISDGTAAEFNITSLGT